MTAERPLRAWILLGGRLVDTAALRRLPSTPDGGTWISYIRCHDDIGWAIDDADAAAVGLSGPAHRAFLSDFYAGESAGSFSDGLVFQANPETGDRRISGTLASLTGASETYNEPLCNAGLQRIKLLTAAVYGFGGLPVIWSGDELALPNDPNWARDPHHAGDNRWAHRPRLPADLVAHRHELGTPASAAFAWFCHLGDVRRSLPQLASSIRSEVLPVADAGVLALGRRHTAGDMVQLYNVTDGERRWPAEWLEGFTLGSAARIVDALTGRTVEPTADGYLILPAWGRLWLVARG